MNRRQAIDTAMRLVMGANLDELAGAQQAYEDGRISQENFAPIKKSFDHTLARRREEIARVTVEILNPPPPVQCAAARRKGDAIVRCTATATTTIGGRGFCDDCAPLVPRKPIPASLGPTT